MTALDGTVVNVALPQIQTELALDEAGLKWVAAIYPLIHASFLLFGGQLAESKGRRLTLLLGVVIFTLASILCGVSTQAAMLIAGRGLQGWAPPWSFLQLWQFLPTTFRPVPGIPAPPLSRSHWPPPWPAAPSFPE